MKSSYKYLLEFLRVSINKDSFISKDNNYDDLKIDEVYNLAKKHNILSLVYEGINSINKFPIEKDNEIIKIWKNKAILSEINQVQKSMEFLKIYDEFLKNNIKPIVVKGITCRELYPFPDSRLSSDEDILIQEDDFNICDKILRKNNMKTLDIENFEGNDVVSYFGKYLMIELHKTLFNEDKKAHVNLFNEFYKNCFEECIELKIQGKSIYTLPPTMNLMYLINHAIKHFLHGGVGIRQVCDIVKFIEFYSSYIDWDYLWCSLKKIKYDSFVFNLLDIGEKYLGLKKELIKYPNWYISENIDSNDLLEDILDAGIFGNSTMERKQSSLITLDAVNKRDKSKERKAYINALFPKVYDLKGRYRYLESKPFLLPIAWCDRIFNYVKEKNKEGSLGESAYKSISIGNKRIELLKKYKVI